MEKTNYSIYQLNDSNEAKKRLHMAFDDIKAKFDGKLYNKVWEGEYEPTKEDEAAAYQDENFKLLNCIVKDLNKDLPHGFYGHMISVSDVIVINGEEAWYVDATGYQKLDDEFLANL